MVFVYRISHTFRLCRSLWRKIREQFSHLRSHSFSAADIARYLSSSTGCRRFTRSHTQICSALQLLVHAERESKKKTEWKVVKFFPLKYYSISILYRHRARQPGDSGVSAEKIDQFELSSLPHSARPTLTNWLFACVDVVTTQHRHHRRSSNLLLRVDDGSKSIDFQFSNKRELFSLLQYWVIHEFNSDCRCVWAKERVVVWV